MNKIRLQIKNYFTGSVLFEYEKENNTIKDTVEEAVRKKADLNSADLNSADLRSADLRFADLNSADLSFADLNSADLSFADLSFADLNSADLNSADLRSADLRFADLRSADLRSADLRFADLSFADLNSAKNITWDYTNWYWHIHHETLYEWLTEPLRARINYIKKEKSKEESPEKIKLRLKLLKPVLGDIPEDQKGWEKLHEIECRCEFKQTIFDNLKGVKNK